MFTINVEQDVRRQYNRRVLFCIRIRGAALLIGLWDLFVHSTALFALIMMFSRPPQLPNPESPMPIFDSYESPTSHILVNNKNFNSNSFLINRIKEKRNATRTFNDMDARQFYMSLDLMAIRWIRSLKEQDQYLVFFILLSATIFILTHLWGVLTNKPSYIVPYFLIKVFNVLVSIFSMLGFYSSLPDIRVWLRLQPDFPLKNYLSDLDNQTLQLITFTVLLLIVLAKLYIAAIIWYCYGYITALNMARTIGTVSGTYESTSPFIGDMYSPPKYEEAIQSNQRDEEDPAAPPPYTPLLASSM